MKDLVLGSALLAALVFAPRAGAVDCQAAANAIGAEPAGYAEQCLGKVSAAQNLLKDSATSKGEVGEVIGYAAQLNPGAEFSPQGLYRFGVPDFNAAERIGTAADTPNMFGLDFNAAATRLYGVQFLANNGGTRIGTFNLETGAFLPIDFALGIPFREQVTGAAIHPRLGQAWITTVDVLTNNPQLSEARLYSLNLTARPYSVSLIGRMLPEQLNPVFIDIAVNCNGEMYGHNITDDAIYRIDTGTAEATLIGSHGLPANFAQGIGFDRATDQLYGWIYTGGGANTFGRFDRETGAFTELSTGPSGQWEGAIDSQCQTQAITPAALTGAWYAPYTDGQGFTARFYGDEAAGTLFMPWFTYSIAGGEESDQQRWYTLFGQVEPGATEISLPILQGLGGVFDSPPAIAPVQVGTAQLKFFSCNEGVLAYQFDEGHNGGAQGRVSMTRLLPSGADCAQYDGSVVEAQKTYDHLFTGSWYDPDTSGQGVEIFRVARIADGDDEDTLPDESGLFYGAWFTFAPPSEEDPVEPGPAGQRWFTLSGQTVDEDGILTTNIVRNLNGSFDNEISGAAFSVGEATLESVSCDRIILTYAFDDAEAAGEFRDLSGEIALSRLGACPPEPPED
jgi:hypothetical protein